MNCWQCSEPVAEGHSFCPHCGCTLEHPSCGQCGATLPNDAKFCPDCGIAVGSRQLTAGSSPEAEFVAVLVAEWTLEDAAEARLDSSARSALVAHVSARVADVVARHGGDVTRQVGRRTVVAFRHGSEHSDHSHGAIEAALKLRDLQDRLLGPAEADRFGIGLSDIQIRLVAHADRPVDGPAAFDAITDVAIRGLDAVGPGGFIATHTLLDRSPGLFTFRDIEGTKGLPPFARVLQVSGVRSAQSSSGATLRTPFISRDVELSFLTDRWQRAATGVAQASLIRGEAGIGKSRLVAALRSRLDVKQYSWIECQCEAELRGSPFRPIATLFERLIGLRHEDAKEDQIARLEGALRTAGFAIDETIPILSQLMDVELPENYPAIRVGREEFRQKALDLLCEWVARIARAQPTVVVIEDLHWSDPSTLEFVTRLIDLIVKDNPGILLLLIAREEFKQSWPQIEQIFLPRFSTEEIEAMADAIAGDRALAGIFTHEVAQRSEGIPLFIEEFTEDILESEASPTSGPSTIEKSMLRRVSRISNPEIAQLASVVGLECPDPLLREIVSVSSRKDLDVSIEKLLSARIVIRRRDAGGDTYRFKHALVRDALYDDLSDENRRAYHGRVADAMEALGSKRLPFRDEVLALHRERAGQFDQAILHYQSAAARASQGSAHAEAVLHFRAALDLLRTQTQQDEAQSVDPADTIRELEILVGLGPSLVASRGYGDPQVAEVYGRAQSLCEEVSEPALLFRALYGMSTYYQAQGRRIRAGEIAEECLTLAEKIGDPAAKILSHQRIGLNHLYGGEIDRALEHLNQALDLYDPTLHRPLAYAYGGDMGVITRTYAAMAYALGGRPDRARQLQRAAFADAKEGGHRHTIGFVQGLGGLVMAKLRDYPRTLEVTEQGVIDSERYGFPLWSGICHVLRGWSRSDTVATRAGASDEIRQALKNLEEIGSVVGTSVFYQLYAEVQLEEGAEQGALDSLAAALEFAETSESPWWNIAILRLQGKILERRGQPEEARAALENAVDTARAQGARSQELLASGGLASLLRNEGRVDEASAVFHRAWEHFASGFDRLPATIIPDVLYLCSGEVPTSSGVDTALRDLLDRLPEDATHRATLRQWLDRSPVSSVVGEPQATSTNGELVAALSPRRLEVLRLVAKGLTNREIGGVLEISAYTAKAHVAGLLEALDLSNRTEAAVALREYERETGETGDSTP